MNNLVKRLRHPPFGTETSERNLMASAADRIEKLEAALRKIAEQAYYGNDFCHPEGCDSPGIACEALEELK